MVRTIWPEDSVSRCWLTCSCSFLCFESLRWLTAWEKKFWHVSGGMDKACGRLVLLSSQKQFYPQEDKEKKGGNEEKEEEFPLHGHSNASIPYSKVYFTNWHGLKLPILLQWQAIEVDIFYKFLKYNLRFFYNRQAF